MMIKANVPILISRLEAMDDATRRLIRLLKKYQAAEAEVAAYDAAQELGIMSNIQARAPAITTAFAAAKNVFVATSPIVE